jgi:hypothetical protein
MAMFLEPLIRAREDRPEFCSFEVQGELGCIKTLRIVAMKRGEAESEVKLGASAAVVD